jgi:tRNA(fMet)-specific endonuclease VapC
VILLDTSALIDHLVDGPLADQVEASIADGSAATSAICVFELLAGVNSAKHLKDRRELVDLIRVVPVSSRIADRESVLFTELTKSGVTIDNEDLIVAATAIVERAALLSANRKHFERVPGLVRADDPA